MSDLKSGRGFALIDPHGDVSQAVVAATPRDRTGDVTYFDPLDEHYTIGFNPLHKVVPPLLRGTYASRIATSFKNIWVESWGPSLEYILTNSIQLLLDNPGTSLVDILRLLNDDHYRKSLLVKCQDPMIRAFWEVDFASWTDRYKAERLPPVQNKVGQLANNPILRGILSHNTIDIDEIMNSRKVLIANLSKRMGDEPSRILGALLTTAFAQGAENRAAIPEQERQDFTLYVDEFQNFATTSFATILSEARKWRLNLCVANQFLDQVPDILKQAVIGNVGTLIVFRVGSIDARLLSDELGIPNRAALTDLPNYKARVKFIDGGVPSEALFIDTLPAPKPTTNRFETIRKRTNLNYARPRKQIEQRLARPTPRPRS